MVDAVKFPTAKCVWAGTMKSDRARSGAHFEDVGVAAIFVHGAREQGFGGTANLAGIRQKPSEAVKTIPVTTAIITPQAAKIPLDETGCAGVSIGRGAFYDPWIFKRTLQYLNLVGADVRRPYLIPTRIVFRMSLLTSSPTKTMLNFHPNRRSPSARASCAVISI